VSQDAKKKKWVSQDASKMLPRC